MNALSAVEIRALIREIGRGTHGARALDRDTAHRMWSALLDGQLPEAVVGAILIAYRFKGESVEELQALRQASAQRAMPLAPVTGPLAILPCYNGGRRLPNLAWLTALALREAGFSVLLHGVRRDAGRLATCEVAQAAGATVAADMAQADRALRSERLAFVPLDVWCPALSRLLARREVLGVRNSGHTVCKLMNPWPGTSAPDAPGRAPASLMLVPVTHAEYVPRATDVLQAGGAAALVFRGVDGEPAIYPHAARSVWRVRPDGVDEVTLTPEITPDPAIELDSSASAQAVAQWSAEVAAGRKAMPQMTARLVALAHSMLESPGQSSIPEHQP